MLKLFLSLFLLINSPLCSGEFVLFTQPKTGTHLLIPILIELTQKNVYWAPEYTKCVQMQTEELKNAVQHVDSFFFTIHKLPWTRQTMDEVWGITRGKNSFLHLHAPYSTEMENYLLEKNCVNFFIKRDPRDQIVSLLNHYKNIQFNDKEVELIPDDHDRLLFMIRKESRIQTVHYMNWIKSPCCCIVNFEKLMGAHGGEATQEEALNEIRRIATALQITASDKQLTKIYEKHFGHSWSFFRGKVGAWKEVFQDIHKLAIKEEIGDLLIQLGYEKNMEW